MMSWIDSRNWTISTGCHFQNGESIQDIIIYPHIKFWWYRTMLNFCDIVAVILKMATGRNFSMSGINSGHHYLPTYQNVGRLWCPELTSTNFYRSPFTIPHKFNIVRFQRPELIPDIEKFLPVSIFRINVGNQFRTLKSNNVEFVRYCKW
jgi:hypothetical protein